MRQEADIKDTSPCKPEHIAFNLRVRDKKREVGPQFRLGARVQVERLNDRLKCQTSQQFTSNEMMSPQFQKSIKGLIHEGHTKDCECDKHNYLNLSKIQSTRASTLGNNKIVDPCQMFS